MNKGKNNSIKVFTIILLLCLVQVVSAQGRLRLPGIIGTNMVLQRNVPMAVWGWASPAERITVSFKGKKYTGIAGKDSTWKITLDVSAAGGPYNMSIATKDTSIQLRNILIGDVWLCSGQSNMEFGIQTEKNGEQAISEAKDSLVHFFFVPWKTALSPQSDIATTTNLLNGKWLVCSPDVLRANWAWHGFSAVGYYFARVIRAAQGVPLGMIGSYKGGTPAQAWISEEGLKKEPALVRHAERHNKLLADYDVQQEKYSTQQSAYLATQKEWDKTKSGFKPQAPAPPDGGFGAPFNLYNGMIAPLKNYALRGVLWYQGESNGDRLEDALEYKTLFPALIRDWRTQWAQKELPFLYVQLTSYRDTATVPSQGLWPWVRYAQQSALALPNTGMAVIYDVGDAKDIHPKNKQDVGVRLSLLARKIVYKEKIIANGPQLLSYDVKGDKVILHFDQHDLLLKVSGSTGYSGFGIAGDDKVFHWATATVKDNTILLSASAVKHPVAVRFNWADSPPAILYNKEGLPATPFRTDNWDTK